MTPPLPGAGIRGSGRTGGAILRPPLPCPPPQDSLPGPRRGGREGSTPGPVPVPTRHLLTWRSQAAALRWSVQGARRRRQCPCVACGGRRLLLGAGGRGGAGALPRLPGPRPPPTSASSGRTKTQPRTSATSATSRPMAFHSLPGAPRTGWSRDDHVTASAPPRPAAGAGGKKRGPELDAETASPLPSLAAGGGLWDGAPRQGVASGGWVITWPAAAASRTSQRPMCCYRDLGSAARGGGGVL